MHQVGVYGMVFKFSVIMSLALQAFRYAADPFFSNNLQNKMLKKLMQE